VLTTAGILITPIFAPAKFKFEMARRFEGFRRSGEEKGRAAAEEGVQPKVIHTLSSFFLFVVWPIAGAQLRIGNRDCTGMVWIYV
jgi:hypothetical protein